jgi:hypothetical protein
MKPKHISQVKPKYYYNRIDVGHMGNKDKNNARKIISDHRNTLTIESVETLSNRHGKKLQHWLSTRDAVDHTLLTRLVKQIKDTNNTNHQIPDTSGLFDSLQYSNESAVSTALERVEHLITICQKANTSTKHKGD